MTFEEFAAARLGAVVRFAAVLAGERALAEDIVQEVLIRAHARWAPFHHRLFAANVGAPRRRSSATARCRG